MFLEQVIGCNREIENYIMSAKQSMKWVVKTNKSIKREILEANKRVIV